MQSSYNVIKNSSVIDNGIRAIETNYHEEKFKFLPEDASSSSEIVDEAILTSYENIASSILENARRQSEDIISQTYIRAELLEEEAAARGYEHGDKQGYTDAYNRAYEEYVIKAQQEAGEIINNAVDIAKCADNILLEANKEYAEFMEAKKAEIISLILDITENIFKKQVVEPSSINDMVIDALEQVKAAKTFVIKCNILHIKALNDAVKTWKKQLTYNCEIFVIEDATMAIGNAVVEKDNGHLEVGIDVGFSRLKEILEEKDV